MIGFPQLQSCPGAEPVRHSHRTMAAESSDDELARLRRLAVVEELLTALAGVLDVRDVFTRVSDIAGRILPHDAISLPVIAEDETHVVAYATTATGNYPTAHPVTDVVRRSMTDPWEFEIFDDLQATPAADPYNASMGYRSELRVPIRLEGRLIAVLVIVSNTPALYRPADVVVARRVADYVALALSHQRLAERARSVDELRARTATLEVLDDLLATLVDTGELPEVFDRLSAIARKVLPHDTLALTVVLSNGKRARVYASSGVDGKPFPETFDIPEGIVRDDDWEHDIADDLQSHPM